VVPRVCLCVGRGGSRRPPPTPGSKPAGSWSARTTRQATSARCSRCPDAAPWPMPSNRALAGDTPGRRARQRSTWRLLLGHVRPYRWTILGGGLVGFLGGLASFAEPMAAKLAVDTLGQRRSLAGPVALLAGVTIGGAPAQHGPPGIRRCGTAGRPRRPPVPSAASGHSPPARVGITGQHRGSLSAHNRADLHAGIHPLQTIVNQPIFGDPAA
jgi:hypothetical protein